MKNNMKKTKKSLKQLSEMTKKELKELVYLATNEMVEWSDFMLLVKGELARRKLS